MESLILAISIILSMACGGLAVLAGFLLATRSTSHELVNNILRQNRYFAQLIRAGDPLAMSAIQRLDMEEIAAQADAALKTMHLGDEKNGRPSDGEMEAVLRRFDESFSGVPDPRA